MFDIGFPELLLVSVVALLVIGPDKLPGTIRTISLWLSRMRRSLATIKAELEAELGADEIREQLHNEGVMKEIAETKNQIDGALRDAKDTLSNISSGSSNISSGSSNISSGSDIISNTSSSSSDDDDTGENLDKQSGSG